MNSEAIFPVYRRQTVIREQHIRSGKLLEVKFYPIFSDGSELPRGPKRKESTKAQKDYNDRQAIKAFVRLINANFDDTDLLAHLTYTVDRAPVSEAEARRDMTNYIRRIKTLRAALLRKVREQLKKDPESRELLERRKKLSDPFRYAYGIEVVEYKTGAKKGRKNYHFHLFMTGWGGRDRDEAEKLWTKGERCNCDRFRPRAFGPEAAARYVAKSPAGTRRFSCSKNMNKPVVAPPKDGKVSPREVERMVKQRNDDRAYWERRHRGYEFLGFDKPPEECYNAYNGYYYLTVKLYRKESPPVRAGTVGRKKKKRC